MTIHSTKELYEMFLESDFWKDISKRKRALVGHCERCPSRKRLQAHHLRYPEHWFDVRLDDLVVLCRACHEKAHGLEPSKPRSKRHHRRRRKSWHFPFPKWTQRSLEQGWSWEKLAADPRLKACHKKVIRKRLVNQHHETLQITVMQTTPERPIWTANGWTTNRRLGIA